jgi:hypothetical protein
MWQTVEGLPMTSKKLNTANSLRGLEKEPCLEIAALPNTFQPHERP